VDGTSRRFGGNLAESSRHLGTNIANYSQT
jgi:hypothetical protein